MSIISASLFNLSTKEPTAKKVPVEVWEALLDLVARAEGMDMKLMSKGQDAWFYYVDSDGGDKFISTLAELDEAVKRNERD